MPTNRRLIINADDLGLSQGVNLGILEAHATGAVTSASMLVNAPGFEDAVSRAARAPGLGIGLHVNLTTGSPITPPREVASLVDPRTGQFWELRELVRRLLLRRIVATHVATECAAQLERLRRTGLAITHFDGHHHVHILPGVWRTISGVMRRAGITAFRVPREPLSRLAWRPAAVVGQVMLRVCLGLTLGRRSGLRHPDQFRGFALTGRSDFRERFLAVLNDLQPGVTELMVHPGYWSPDLIGWGRLQRQREWELGALISVPVYERLRRGDFELVHFGVL